MLDADSTTPPRISDDRISDDAADFRSYCQRGRQFTISAVYWVKMLLSYGREFCFAFAVIITVYAALQSSPPKMRIAGHPQPFFPLHSPILDYYWGNVHHAFSRMQDSDISFTLYYAPWDAASMEARWEFEKAARYYDDQVFFVAINCWWTEGECRRRFPKIQSFPVLIVYRNSGKGIQFHGPPRAPHMVSFLSHAIDPLHVIRTRMDILRLRSKHSAVVVGFFDFKESPKPKGYTSFYIAALKALEKDPARDIAFAVISNVNEAVQFGINTTNTIHLILWNSTQAFHYDTLSSHKLLQWIFERHQTVVRRLSPPGVKSQMLSGVLQNSPTIIMMTPRFVTTHLLESPFNYLFREVALDYFNCNVSSLVDVVVHVGRMQVNELKSRRHIYGDDGNGCYCQSEMSDAVDGDIFADSKCCLTLKMSSANGRCDGPRPKSVCEVCSLKCPTELVLSAQYWRRPFPDCVSLRLNYDSRSRYSLCCVTSTNSSIERLSSAQQRRCSISGHPQIANRLNFWTEQVGSKKWSNFTGLGCATNRTLTFAVMDSLTHGIFFDRLGVDFVRIPSLTAVAILDNDQESHYLLEQPVTLTSLREFIINFTSGNLARYRRSSSPAIPTPPEITPAPDLSVEEIEIVEMSGSNFDVVMNGTKDVVLLIYTPSCAFCLGIAHIYLTTARYFQAAQKIVFARINGEANDLPWEFTADKYPTILFFPAQQQMESFDYPDDQPITVANLIHFVLMHATLELRVRIALSLCTASCIDHNRRMALDKIHTLLRRYRVLDGRFRSALHVLRRVRHPRIKDNVDGQRHRRHSQLMYAKGVARDMCSVKVQLRHVRTLHFVLSTSEGDRLTAKQLEVLTRSHGDFREELDATRAECDSLGVRLRNAVGGGGGRGRHSKTTIPVR